MEVGHVIVVEMGAVLGPECVLHHQVGQWRPELTGVPTVALHQTWMVVDRSLVGEIIAGASGGLRH